MVFMGIDAGTQGVRAVAADGQGGVLGEGVYSYKRLNLALQEAQQCYEQSADDWYEAMAFAVRQCIKGLEENGFSAKDIKAVGVCATSGTIVPVDSNGEALCNALLYNDLRSVPQAKEIERLCPELALRLGYRFSPSFSLPKLMWICQNEPKLYEKTAVFCHQADYLTARLCGEFGISDYTNAQKSGYDSERLCWRKELFTHLGLDSEKLPRVVAPKDIIGTICPAAARDMGLCGSTQVVAGTTDATAAVIAAGAVRAGEAVSVLGTTLVCKAIASSRVTDPDMTAYPYRLPNGCYLIGGASNIGGRALNEAAASGSFQELDTRAEPLLPTGVRCYPIYGRGERFPFNNPQAEAFFNGNIFGGRLYPALMEGVAFGERLIYERLEQLGCSIGDTIFTGGGACKSPVWLKIRASVLSRSIKVPQVVSSAMGSAMLAAASHIGSLEEAAGNMSKIRLITEPDSLLAVRYDEIYSRFREECRTHYGI